MRARLLYVLPSARPSVHVSAESGYAEPLPAVLEAPNNTYLRGYWQWPLYVDAVEERLRADFVFREPLDPHNAEVAAAILSATRTVSVQVRRSDYATEPEARQEL